MLPDRLHDCHSPGDPASELILTEGEMAANAVLGVRNHATQAVLAMRGKPINAITAAREKVLANDPVLDLFDAMGCGVGDECDPDRLRYGSVALLMDADADGIHSSALLTILFDRYHLPVLEAGRVRLIRAPLYRIEAEGTRYAYRDDERVALVSQLDADGVVPDRITRFRSIAHMNGDELERLCVAPTSRVSATVTVSHALAAAASYERMRRMLQRNDAPE